MFCWPQRCSQGSALADEAKVWSLEQAYWQYVQANDLDGYRTLWHADFLGWPFINDEPTRKEHITDWITAHTQKGNVLNSYDLERLPVQVTRKVATTTYRVRSTWVDKNGAGKPTTSRIIHTWLRDSGGTWQIVSGISANTERVNLP